MPPLARFLLWLVAGIGLVCGVALIAAHLPARVKLLGLFAIGVGVLMGWGLGELARRLRVGSGISVACAAFLLTAAGIAGITVRSHQVWSSQVRASLGADPWALFDAQMEQGTDAKEDTYAEVRRQLEQSRADRRRKIAERTSFSTYLERRAPGAGKLLWVSEILLGATAGAWMAGRCSAESKVLSEKC